MRRAVLFLLLAGCAVSEPAATRLAAPEPRAVTLFRDTVTVQFTDGALCTLPREARSGGWSGALLGCPHRWPVEVRQPTARPRVPLTPTDAAPWVVLQGPDGARGYAPPGAPAS